MLQANVRCKEDGKDVARQCESIDSQHDRGRVQPCPCRKNACAEESNAIGNHVIDEPSSCRARQRPAHGTECIFCWWRRAGSHQAGIRDPPRRTTPTIGLSQVEVPQDGAEPSKHGPKAEGAAPLHRRRNCHRTKPDHHQRTQETTSSHASKNKCQGCPRRLNINILRRICSCKGILSSNADAHNEAPYTENRVHTEAVPDSSICTSQGAQAYNTHSADKQRTPTHVVSKPTKAELTYDCTHQCTGGHPTVVAWCWLTKLLAENWPHQVDNVEIVNVGTNATGAE
mmetsp:Transcript_56111/g.108263  ORF Transcript_56111/g.108263 Transcript_56111/m.108263 type:complete len:285 (-) Transcript_56111:138-992(-)